MNSQWSMDIICPPLLQNVFSLVYPDGFNFIKYWGLLKLHLWLRPLNYRTWVNYLYHCYNHHSYQTHIRFKNDYHHSLQSWFHRAVHCCYLYYNCNHWYCDIHHLILWCFNLINFKHHHLQLVICVLFVSCLVLNFHLVSNFNHCIHCLIYNFFCQGLFHLILLIILQYIILFILVSTKRWLIIWHEGLVLLSCQLPNY